MRLRAKVLIIFGLTLPVMAAVLTLASHFLMRGFEQVESEAIQEHVHLAARYLVALEEDLGATTQDWATWEDTARFVQDRNPEFARTILVPAPLQKYNVDIIVLLDPAQQVVYNGLRRDGAEQLLVMPPETLKLLTAIPGLTRRDEFSSACQGTLSLPDGLFLVASRPIVTNGLQDPVRGTLIFGRRLTPARIAAISRRTRQSIAIQPLAVPAASPRITEIITALAQPAAPPAVVRPVSKDVVGGYRFICDLTGRPVALLGIERERTIYNQGRATVYCLLILITAFAVLCSALTLFLLDRLVLVRISKLNRCVAAIGKGQRPEPMPHGKYPDELSLLADSLHDTLDALLQSQDRLQITQFSIDHAADPVVWIGPDARIRYVNEATGLSLGYTRDELLSMKIHALDPNLPPEVWPAHWAEVARRGSKVLETVLRARDGRLIPVEVTVTAMQFQGEDCHCSFMRDITERKRSDERLRHAATHDSLTGLPNRALLAEHLDQAIALAAREPDYRFAVMYLDFDRFKIINDSLGHHAGDELLIAVGNQLQECLRSREMAAHMSSGEVARLGGDEFVILLEGVCSTDDAVAVAREIQTEVSRPFTISGHQAHVTASIGIVSSELGYGSPADVLRDADIAMYEAKARGKARHVVFDRQMHDQVVFRLQLENDLRKAVDAQEINVAYQPIVSLENGDLEGFEALARWKHSTRGDIPPDEFIPIAEETGLILPLGRMVLRKSCRQWVRFRELIPDAPPVVMSVNVSKRQLLEPGLAAEVERILHELEMPAAYLKLEVTESVIMQSAETITPVLEDLKSLGIKLAMDDFGQGHSSLGSLHLFPIDYLKIDRAFVTNMGLTKAGLNIEYTAIVHAIVTLAHNLGMQVVAEGVETVGQLVQLQALGCDFGQGHYFSRCTPPEGAAALIASKTWLGATVATE